MHQDELKISKIFHFGRKPPSSKPGLSTALRLAFSRGKTSTKTTPVSVYQLQFGTPARDTMKSKASKVT